MEKYVYDYTELEERMKNRKYSQSTLSDEVNMARNSLNLKLNNKGNFTQKEIKRIAEKLEIPMTQIGKYFFTPVVQKTEQTT
ncbi:hypothetical protein BG261_02980 [Floricoccus tropicus]|uniref:HTH cro/C1-type domain-containing protein n=1 Tax=Floricoccus tropicus TaxID=1859473 RepID=A0A1E8GMT3_9LACT|nr:DUF739 family protein [Floricoccus tropicus]OFI49559.1 hypothetical protein BG261_02980 [Floricoccus tropicus]